MARLVSIFSKRAPVGGGRRQYQRRVEVSVSDDARGVTRRGRRNKHVTKEQEEECSVETADLFSVRLCDEGADVGPLSEQRPPARYNGEREQRAETTSTRPSRHLA